MAWSDTVRKISSEIRRRKAALASRRTVRAPISIKHVIKSTKSKGGGWSDAARAASLEVRRRKMKGKSHAQLGQNDRAIEKYMTSKGFSPTPPPDSSLPTTRAEARAWFKEMTGLVLTVDGKADHAMVSKIAIISQQELARLREEFGLLLPKRGTNLPGSSMGILSGGHGFRSLGIFSEGGSRTWGETTRTVSAGANGMYSRGDVTLTTSLAKHRGGLGMVGEGIDLSSNRWTTGNTMGATFRHEMGHASQGWIERRAKQIFPHDPGPRTVSVSRYAQTNRSELFAESFALYTSNGYGTSEATTLPAHIHEWFTKYLPRKKKS